MEDNELWELLSKIKLQKYELKPRLVARIGLYQLGPLEQLESYRTYDWYYFG